MAGPQRVRPCSGATPRPLTAARPEGGEHPEQSSQQPALPKTHFPIVLLCLPLKRPLLVNRAAGGASWRR